MLDIVAVAVAVAGVVNVVNADIIAAVVVVIAVILILLAVDASNDLITVVIVVAAVVDVTEDTLYSAADWLYDLSAILSTLEEGGEAPLLIVSVPIYIITQLD